MAKSTSVTISTEGVGLDTRDFARFAKALRKASPELATALRVELRAAGNIVAETAEINAADASKTIPPSIKVRVSAATVSVVAGGKTVPLAGLMELGNKGNRTAAATFRHPVYGHWTNAAKPQRTHPYLAPAVQESGEAAQAAVVEALDRAIAVAVSPAD